MSTTHSVAPVGVPEAPDRPKRSRFAGERLGAWVFAASFSIGIWGLALKVLEPAHTAANTAAPRYLAELAPSAAADGHATVIWAPISTQAANTSPTPDVAPTTTIEPQDTSTSHD